LIRKKLYNAQKREERRKLMIITWEGILKLYPFLEALSKTYPWIKESIIKRITSDSERNPGDPSMVIQLKMTQALEDLNKTTEEGFNSLNKTTEEGFNSLGIDIKRSNIYSGLFAGKLANPDLARENLAGAWEFAEKYEKTFKSF
jgi:hypothetical protein